MGIASFPAIEVRYDYQFSIIAHFTGKGNYAILNGVNGFIFVRFYVNALVVVCFSTGPSYIAEVRVDFKYGFF